MFAGFAWRSRGREPFWPHDRDVALVLCGGVGVEVHAQTVKLFAQRGA